MADISQVKLPDGTTYNLKDSYVRINYRALSNNDFDTINVTELNGGDLIVTGAARFLNTINGSISGNAVTATKATQDESGNNIKATYAASFSISDHTITLKNKNGVSLGTVTVPDNNDNTWRKVQVNGTDILGTATNTNPLNLKAGTNVSLSNSSGTVTITATDTNTTYSLSASDESVVLTGSDSSSSTANLSTAFANYTPYKGNLTSIIGSASPASAMKTYWENNDNIKPTSVNTAYNTAGQEYAFLLSKGGSNQYGAVIRWGYGTKYFEILRKYGSTWKDNDWVKMDAGYADKAGADGDGNTITTTYLPKTTYEWNKEVSFGSSGKLLIGKFSCYDSNVTIEINSTTGGTYHATAVLATQNVNDSGGGTITWKTYGDASNTVTPNLYLYYPSNSRWIEIYFSPSNWSKNIIHIQCLGLYATPTNICESVTEIPAEATIQPTNTLLSLVGDYLPLSGGTLTGDLLFSNSGTNIRQIKGINGDSDAWRIAAGATAQNAGWLEIATADDYNEPIYVRQYKYAASNAFGTVQHEAVLLDANGNTSFPKNVTATKFIGALQGNADTATTASQLAEDISYITSGTSFVVHTTKKTFKTYLSRRNNLGISSATGGMMVLAGTWESGNYTSELALGMGDNYGIYYRGSNSSAEQAWQEVGRFTATPTTGKVVVSDGAEGGIKASGYTIATSVPSGAVFTDQYVSQSATTTSDYRKIVLSYQNGAAGAAVTSNTNVVYVTANAEVQPSTGNIRSAGTVSAANLSATTNVTGVTFGVATTSGTTGGISLYNGASQVDTYGIAFRLTSNKEKHGYVQGDWATYFTMNSGATTRGWVFRTNTTNGNVASISGGGNAVFNGSVTVGGNTTNTSGVRQVYNSTTKSLDFVFVA